MVVLRSHRFGVESRRFQVVEDGVHAGRDVGGQFGLVLLDQAAHREGAKPDGFHVEGRDGAFEVLAEIDQLGGQRGLGLAAQDGDEGRSVVGRLLAGRRGAHVAMIATPAVVGKDRQDLLF